MSGFQLVDCGGGRYRLAGEMTFATASDALEATAPLFKGGIHLQFDLKGIRRADSAGVALLIEWMRRAKQARGGVRYSGLPEALRAMSRVGGVEELLPVDSSET